MRLLIDLQACFAPNTAGRGIGLYSERLASALCRSGRQHEVHLLLPHTGRDVERLAQLRRRFRACLPARQVHLLHLLDVSGAPAGEAEPAARLNRASRHGLIQAVDPDVLLVTSLFELGRDYPVDLPDLDRGPRTAVVLYDLLPLEDTDALLPTQAQRQAYMRQVEELQRADMLLSISQFTSSRAAELLEDAPSVATVLGAAVLDAVPVLPRDLPSTVRKPFVLCVGGDHPRKNLPNLVRAWGRVDESVRQDRRLVISCKLSEATASSLRSLATSVGLPADALHLTGFVPDRELAALYAEADLSVFPSFAEGLGLPALEAGHYGCPVVVADNTSLRELAPARGRFQAADPQDMAEVMTAALSDGDVIAELEQHASRLRERYTWQNTATAAWDALEDLPARPAAQGGPRKTLAVVSPWPPARSGVADFALTSSRALQDHYDVTLVGYAPDDAGFGTLSLERFLERWGTFDRVLYHFGNSPHHVEHFRALPAAPGVVIVHDTAVTATLRYVDEALGHPAGVDGLLAEVGPAPGEGQVDLRGLAAICAGAVGLQVQSKHALAEVARAGVAHLPTAVIQLPTSLRADPVLRQTDREHVTIGHFGFVQEFKQPDMLIAASAKAQIALGRPVRVVFVGEVGDATYQARLAEIARAEGVRTDFLGFVDEQVFAAWEARVDCAVQLRSVSHGESSGSVASLLTLGVPVIVSDIGSFAELPRDVVLHQPPDGGIDGLATLLTEAVSPAGAALGARAREYAQRELSAESWARRTHAHLERCYRSNPAVQASSALRPAVADAPERLVREFGRRLAGTCERLPGAARLLASDVSVLAETPFLTGIQRVVLSTHRELVPLLAARGQALVSTHISGRPADVSRQHRAIRADPVTGGVSVRVEDSDWFLGLDLNFDLPARAGVLREAQARGTYVLVNVYDMLPVSNPEWFPPRTAADVFEPWLHAVCSLADVITVNSRSTQEALVSWVERAAPELAGRLPVHVVPLAAEPPQQVSSRSRPMDGAPRFVVVGTLEPRKGHEHILDAFDLLWRSGQDVELVLIGRQGWMVERLAERVRRHPELGRRLTWLQEADDERVEAVLATCDAAIMASQGEGFGLPVVEALARRIPVIARDIPVLRELAAQGVEYFRGDGAGLAAQVDDWCARRRRGEHVGVSVPSRTWQDVAKDLLRVIDDVEGAHLPETARGR